MVRAMRPHQWLKNLLVFVPILTAHALGEVGSWVNAALAFAALSATASAIYIVNDLTDLAADRRHPRKRRRPFASGALDPVSGGIMAAFLLTLGIGLGHACGVLPVLAVYAACSLSYSFKLKELPLVDIFTLAALYTLRLFAGGEATGHLVSLWLLGFSSFLFLSLAALKRVEELMALAQRSGRQAARRGYLAEDAAILQMFGCCAAFMSSVVLALFVQNEAAAQQYASPALLWATVPLILFWECRLWLSTARGYMHDDPIVYAARDWVSWLVAAAVTIILIAARFPW
jgi:4-hydroxybenzoate polyprenyltransferase